MFLPDGSAHVGHSRGALARTHTYEQHKHSRLGLVATMWMELATLSEPELLRHSFRHRSGGEPSELRRLFCVHSSPPTPPLASRHLKSKVKSGFLTLSGGGGDGGAIEGRDVKQASKRSSGATKGGKENATRGRRLPHTHDYEKREALFLAERYLEIQKRRRRRRRSSGRRAHDTRA